MNRHALMLTLIALLGVQLALTGWVWRETAEAPAATVGGVLIAAPADAVSEIELDDGKRRLLLKRNGDGWVLPQAHDFPAGSFQVARLLDAVLNLHPGLPVADSTDAARRFRVAGDAFTRRVILRHEGKVLETLYIGDAAGPRRVYGRLGGQTAVYPLLLDRYALVTDVNAWTDKTWLHRPLGDINGVHLPGIDLRRHGDGWRLADQTAEEQLDTDKVDDLVERIANLDFMAVAGVAAPEPAGEPLLTITLELAGDRTMSYRFRDPGQQGDPLLQVSGSPFVLRVAGFMLQPLQEITRDTLLVQPPEAGTPTASPEGDIDAPAAPVSSESPAAAAQ